MKKFLLLFFLIPAIVFADARSGTDAGDTIESSLNLKLTRLKEAPGGNIVIASGELSADDCYDAFSFSPSLKKGQFVSLKSFGDAKVKFSLLDATNNQTLLSINEGDTVEGKLESDAYLKVECDSEPAETKYAFSLWLAPSKAKFIDQLIKMPVGHGKEPPKDFDPFIDAKYPPSSSLMTTKNIIIAIIVLVLAVGAYCKFPKKQS